MSKTNNATNIFRNDETAKALADIVLAQKAFCERYSLTSANMNTKNVEEKNKITTFNESFEVAKEIVETMHLQDDFMKAVARCELYVDKKAIVLFIGAVYDVYVATSKLSKADKEKYAKLYNDTLDTAYNERKLKKATITKLTETRHQFTSIDDFKEFFELFAKAIMSKQTAKQTAKQTEQKADSKAKEQSAKQSKTKIKSATAEQLAELTKEIIESETKNA